MTGVTYDELLHIIALDKYDKLMLIYDYMIAHGLIEDA
jgi:hypothetical protein